jgi:protease I
MKASLQGKKVAILATNGFEQSELIEPREALEKAGAETEVISPAGNEIRGWAEQDWGDSVPVDVPLKKANPEDYDALLLPGGVMNPDKLRMEEKAVEFVRHFFDEGKPVGAICHGPQILINAAVVRDRTLTSWPSLEVDLRNAGAEWVDKQVVVDNGLVTSRKPADIPAFSKKLIEEIGEGVHEKGKPSQFARRRMAASGVD